MAPTVFSRYFSLVVMSSSSTIFPTPVRVSVLGFLLFLSHLISSGVVSKLEKLSGKTIPAHKVDLTEKEEIRAVFGQYNTSQSRVSSVIHFAALKSVGESCKVPLRYYGNNVTGSIYLLEVMMEFNVKKIVFSSSATVYGQPQYLPIDENHPTGNCTNPYGKSKLFMEEIFKVSFRLTFNLEADNADRVTNLLLNVLTPGRMFVLLSQTGASLCSDISILPGLILQER